MKNVEQDIPPSMIIEEVRSPRRQNNARPVNTPIFFIHEVIEVSDDEDELSLLLEDEEGMRAFNETLDRRQNINLNNSNNST